MSRKKFPLLLHVTYEPDVDGDDDYVCTFTDGVNSLDAGTRVAIYTLTDEGTVLGPKSFVSNKKGVA